MVNEVNTSPEFKGIKTTSANLVRVVVKVNTIPEFKWIKTTYFTLFLHIPRSKYQP